MKKALVARGFIGAVASLLGVSAVGCSSEPLSPEEAAEIGVSEQALTNANVVDQSDTFDWAGSDDTSIDGSACSVVDPGNSNKLLVIAMGGLNSTGNYEDQAVLYIPGTGYSATTTFTTARAFGTAIQDPNDNKSCLLFGGEDGASVKSQIIKVTVSKSGSVYSLASSDVGALSTARSHVRAVAIPGGKVMIMGGFTGLNETTASNVIDIWDSAKTGSTAIPTLKNISGSTVTLNVPRGSFAAEVSGQNASRILLGGGLDNTGNPTDVIEAIELDASQRLNASNPTVKPVNVTSVSPSGRVKLSVARSGLPLVFTSQVPGGNANRDRFVFGPGSASAAVDLIDVNWSNFADNTAGHNTAPVDACAGTATALTAVSNPLAVKMANDRFVLVGSTGSNKNRVQEYNAGTCTTVTQDSTPASLVSRQGALGALGGDIPGVSAGPSVFYTVGATASGGTFHQSTFEVTP